MLKQIFPRTGFFLFLMGLALYAHTLPSSFHFDDYHGIVENYAIRNLNNLPAIWNAFNTKFVAGLSFAFNYALGGLNVFGYHLFNLICHILSSWLVYVLVLLTLQTPSMRESLPARQPGPLALMAALFFLVHPIQTQAVTYVWQRITSLAAFFYLASVVLYAKARFTSRWYYFLGAFLTTVLAMFTKEITETLPLMLALYEFCFFGRLREGRKRRLLFLLPFLLTLTIIPLTLTRSSQVTLPLLKPPSRAVLAAEGRTFPRLLSDMMRWPSSEQRPRKEYLLTQLNVIRTYLRLLFFPVRQNLDYDYPIAHSLTEPATLFSFSLLVSICLVALKSFRRDRLIAFGIFWFLIALSVESLVVLPDVIFEHRLYLPMAGFSIFLSAVLFLFLRDTRRFVAVSSAIVVLFAMATYRRNGVWENEITLWQDAVRKSPRKARAHSSLGFAYLQKGDYDKGIGYCREAVQLNPGYPDTYAILGDAYFRKKEIDEAIRCYTKTVELDPSYAAVYNNLGVAYHEKGEGNKEIVYYQKAIQLDPGHALAYRNLGLAYLRKGEQDRTIESIKKAIRLDPHHAEDYNLLGVAYGKKGGHRQAVDCFKKALELDPLYAEARANLKVAVSLANRP